MLEVLGKLVIGVFLAAVIVIISESISGGGPVIKGTKKYNQINKDSDAKVKNILKNGSGSSKKELQNWWDEHH
jgi:hypothetical protein